MLTFENPKLRSLNSSHLLKIPIFLHAFSDFYIKLCENRTNYCQFQILAEKLSIFLHLMFTVSVISHGIRQSLHIE